tara:strand:- start:541 stop:651 length:111 start_codon:yes stop_codon:yes gene_type:complete
MFNIDVMELLVMLLLITVVIGVIAVGVRLGTRRRDA